VFRFLTGLGLGAEWGPGAAIVAEFWPPASRGRAAGALHSAYGVGLLLASGVWLLLSPHGSFAWRYMFVIGIMPAFLLLFLRRWVDEPAIWIACKRNRQEAQRRVGMGDASEQDRELARFTLICIFSDPMLRRRVGLLLLMSVTTVAGYWSASTWIPQFAAQLATSGQQSHLSASVVGLMYGVGSIAGYLVLGLLADFLGHKPTIWLYFLGALTFSLCLFLLAREQHIFLVMAAMRRGRFPGMKPSQNPRQSNCLQRSGRDGSRRQPDDQVSCCLISSPQVRHWDPMSQAGKGESTSFWSSL
jgi:MFS family permease